MRMKPEQAAVREVLEETGIEARTRGRAGQHPVCITPVNGRTGRKIFKVVTFHLMKYHAGTHRRNHSGMRHEVRRAWWMPLRTAPTRLSYEGEREMARKAVAYLKSPSKEF